MNGLINYYQGPPADYREVLRPGAICRAPIPFALVRTPNRLRLRYQDERNPLNSDFSLEATDFGNYDPCSDPPLRHLHMKQDEFLLAVPSKLRSCVLLSDPVTGPGVPESGFSVVPLYSLRDEAGNYRRHFTMEIVQRAQGYQIESFFYMPGAVDYSMNESVARLERIQFVRVEHIFPKAVVMTTDAFDCLRQWVANFFGVDLALSGALQNYMESARLQIESRFGAS